jgi:hypothetical protein
MTSIVIAGKASDPGYAQVSLPNKAEMLGHYLANNLPDFKIRLVPLADAAWPKFRDDTYVKYLGLI